MRPRGSDFGDLTFHIAFRVLPALLAALVIWYAMATVALEVARFIFLLISPEAPTIVKG